MEKFKKFITSPIVILIGLIIVGFILRFLQLTPTDFWYDEAFTGSTIRAPWAEMFTIIKDDKVHPPVYYILAKLWTMLFQSTSVSAIRGFSMFWGLLTIPLVFWGVQQFPGDKKKNQILALIIAGVFAIDPYFVAYSIEARSYALLTFLILLSLFLFVRFIRSPYKVTKDAIFLALTLILIASIHYIGVVAIPSYILAYIFIVLIDKGLFFDKKFWYKVVLIVPVLIVATLGILVQTPPVKGILAQSPGWIPSSDMTLVARSTYDFLFGVDRQARGIPPANEFWVTVGSLNIGYIIFTTFLIIGIFTGIRLYREKEKPKLKLLVVMATLALAPIVSIVLLSRIGINLYVERYIIGYGAILVVLMLWLCSFAPLRRVLYIVGAYVLLLIFLIYPQPMKLYRPVLSQLQLTNDTKVYIGDPGSYVIFLYYLPNNRPLLLVNNPSVRYDGFALIHPNDLVLSDSVPKGAYVILDKSTTDIPELKTWIKVGETNTYFIFKNE